MTDVKIDMRVFTQDGDKAPVPAPLYWSFTPTRLLVDSDHVVLPQPFTARLVAGVATATFLPDDGESWCWHGVATGAGSEGVSERYFHVPESDTELAFYAAAGADDPKISDVVPVAPGELIAASLEYVDNAIGLKADATALAALRSDTETAAGEEADTRGAADTALQTSINGVTNAIPGLVDDAVADAAEIQLAGVELANAEYLTNFTTTSAAFPGTAITGLSVTVIGSGRPVDIELYCPRVWHSVASTAVSVYFTTTSGNAAVECRSASTTGGPAGIARRRMVLTNGVSYTFTASVYGAAAGTSTIGASAAGYGPIRLSVTSR